jgi:ATP-dependent Lon protease
MLVIRGQFSAFCPVVDQAGNSEFSPMISRFLLRNSPVLLRNRNLQSSGRLLRFNFKSYSTGNSGNNDDDDSSKKDDKKGEKVEEKDVKEKNSLEKKKKRTDIAVIRGKAVSGRGKKTNKLPLKSPLIQPSILEVPEYFPDLLAIPLTRRPLFPGFYKSLFIKDPLVIAAIEDLVASGNPYIGVFLSKDDSIDSDIVADVQQVEKVGVFAQIINSHHSGPDNSYLTVVVYPHRRIRINEVVPVQKLDIAQPKVTVEKSLGNGMYLIICRIGFR